MRTILWVAGVLSSFSASGQTQRDSIPKMLEEVSVTTQARSMRNTNGNLKIDVATSIYKAAPNALELLSRLPMVQLSPDRERLSIVGRGEPLLYLDNQRVTLNEVNALDVADIRTIEIIQNPSSRYDADGRTLVRITRKASKKEGFKATVSETLSFKKKFNNYAGLNASLRNNKTTFKINTNLNHLNPWESNGVAYEIGAQDVRSNYRVAGFTKRRQYVLGLGVVQEFSQDDYLTFNVNLKFQPDDFRFSTQTLNQFDGMQNSVRTLGNNKGHRNFANAFVNYNKKIAYLNADFFTGLQYSGFDQQSAVRSFNNYNQTQYELFQDDAQHFVVHAFSGRMDLEKTFQNEMRYAIGASYSQAQAQTGFNLVDFEKLLMTNSHYSLLENNAAAYTEYSGRIKSFSWTTGIRVEKTHIRGQYRLESQPFIRKDYAHFFPKLQLGVHLDSSKTIGFHYSKTISRPNYATTSQGITYINPYFAFSSNINLDPALLHEFALTFQYKDKTLRAVYYENRDVVYYGFSFQGTQNLLLFSPTNFDKEHGYSLEWTLPFTYKRWTATTVLNAYLNTIEDANAITRKSTPFVYLYSNHVLTLPQDWLLSWTATAMSRRKEGLYDRNGFLVLDLGISKQWLGCISATLSWNNILKDITYKEDFTYSGVAAKAQYFSNTREIAVALRYTFGKVKETALGEKSIEETSRIH